jgi:hypothetical protein
VVSEDPLLPVDDGDRGVEVRDAISSDSGRERR